MAGLYFHIPYCRAKCDYCDFFSVADAQLSLDDYVRLLLRQVSLEGGQPAPAGPLDTVFFGGGTPSLLAPEAVARLLAAVDRRWGLAAGAEISLEANPGSVSGGTLAGYRAAGINRLSLGVQSFSPGALEQLGRRHTVAQADRALEEAREAGFDNLSVDLMNGLPGQTLAELDQELARLLAWQPEHVSCYGLTVEPGTLLARRRELEGIELPGEEQAERFFRRVHAVLEAAGYHHYEISNFARPGRDCRHNLGYWRRQSCLALGAGAHGFDARGWGRRLAAPADLAAYAASLELGRDPLVLLEAYDRQGAMSETLYLGLRTAEGVAEAGFVERFGCGVAEAFPEALSRLGERLVRKAGRWRFDLAGWLLFDHLILPFLQ